jgi:hypothetical protein
MIARLLGDDIAVARAARAARLRAAEHFAWGEILLQYEGELARLGGKAPVWTAPADIAPVAEPARQL